jgi:hypothetical protein
MLLIESKSPIVGESRADRVLFNLCCDWPFRSGFVGRGTLADLQLPDLEGSLSPSIPRRLGFLSC